MNFNLIIAGLLLAPAFAIQKQITATQQSKAQRIVSVIISCIGLIIIVLEALVWKKQQNVINIEPSALFTSQKIQQGTSTSVEIPQKLKQERIEQVSCQDVSPAIKKIAEQNEGTSNQRKRKRKADRLSDRRNQDQASMQSQD